MNKFIYKTAQELENMSPEEQEAYLVEKRKHEESLQKALISEATEPIKNDISKISEDLTSIREQIKAHYGEAGVNALKTAILEREEEIKGLYRKGSGVIEIDIAKQVGSVTTTTGTVPTFPSEAGVQFAGGLSNANLRSISIENFLTKLKTNSPVYTYVEVKPKEGDFEAVAEGAKKPQTDLTWETNYAQPKKIAAYVRVTEEAINDVAGLESVISDFLQKKHQLKKGKLLLSGDGTGANPKGLFSYGKAFTAGSLAASIEQPNLLDVINACIVKVASTHNYEDEASFVPNLVLLNPMDFFIHFASAKNKQGDYLFPTASILGNVTVGGVTIATEESVPAGKIFVGDATQYNITDYMPYIVKIGWVNDDFIKNQFVILAESRFHAFVRKAGEVAFIYDDIATIKTAITKPTP